MARQHRTDKGDVEVVATFLIDETGEPVASNKTGQFKILNTEDLGLGTKYILKSDGVNWVMFRKTYTATSSQRDYAGAMNNEGVTREQAWVQRDSLVYGAPNEAGI